MNLSSVAIMCLRIFFLSALLFSQPVAAEWLANTGLGVTYSDNYALQNGDYTNIDQEVVDRTGTELSGAISWQSFKNNGGFSLDAAALLDKASDRDSQISNLSLSASRIQSLSQRWMARFTGRLLQYNNDDFTANAYDGIRLEATTGWFGENGRGVDMMLSWVDEDHNQNPESLYKIQRFGASAVYYFSYAADDVRNSVSLGVQQHDASDDRRDGSSLFFSTAMDQIRWGKNLLRLSVNWRQDRYDLAYTPQPGDQTGGVMPPGTGVPGNPGMGPGTGPGTGPGSGAPATSEPRTDTQVYLSASYQYPLSRDFRLFINANTGRYSSVTGKQSYYNLFSGIRWYFN